MIADYLPYEEHKALVEILAHHGLSDEALIKDLAAFGNWIHTAEADKVRLGRVPQAPFLISFLSMRGIYPKKKEPSNG